jgi:hypothetical protein
MVRALKRLAESHERMPVLKVLPGATAALAAVLEGLHTSTGIRKSKEKKQGGKARRKRRVG